MIPQYFVHHGSAPQRHTPARAASGQGNACSSSHPGLLKDRLRLRLLGGDGRSFGAITSVTKLRKGNTKTQETPLSTGCLND